VTLLQEKLQSEECITALNLQLVIGVEIITLPQKVISFSTNMLSKKTAAQISQQFPACFVRSNVVVLIMGNKMTKQDYEIIAELFRWSLFNATHVETIFAMKLINKFMELAGNQNSRFDRNLFLKACGVK